MKQNRRNHKSDILIDLTSLLDVVFILLLVVLCSQKTLYTNLQNDQVEAQSVLAEANKQKELYADLIDTEMNITQYVASVSISAPYDENTITQREIRVVFEGDEMKSFPLNGNSVGEAMNQFKEYLWQKISGNKEIPVIISFNAGSDRILYRDELAIKEILSDLAKETNNLYFKEEFAGG